LNESPAIEVPAASVTAASDINRSLPLRALLMAGSGCAALIYEIVWLQLLQLVIGSSAISLALLLAAYMGGLCLGSAIFSRVVSPRHHPLRVYAVLEPGIGLPGVLAQWLPIYDSDAETVKIEAGDLLPGLSARYDLEQQPERRRLRSGSAGQAGQRANQCR
jgi:hypothetical protein